MTTLFSFSIESDIPIVCITESAYASIIGTIGSLPAETGGLLFGYEDDYIIRGFLFDKHAITTSSTYTFNTGYLNPIVSSLWKKKKLSVLGFIHSHPQGASCPSIPDIEYFSKMFEVMPRSYYVIPIVFSHADGGYSFYCYLLFPGESSPVKAHFIVVPDDFIVSKKIKRDFRIFPSTKRKPRSKYSDTTILNLC